MSLGEELGNIDIDCFGTTFEATAEKMEDPGEEQAVMATAEEQFPILALIPDLIEQYSTEWPEAKREGAQEASRLIVGLLSEYAIATELHEQFPGLAEIDDSL